MPVSGQRRRRISLHIKRYGEILTVLVRYGFGDVLSRLNIEKYSFFPRALKGAKSAQKVQELDGKLTSWERLRLVLEDLGPTFVKLGQFMSNRPDILPPDLITELEKLQDATRPFPAEEARKIVEEEWGKTVGENLAEFSSGPMASASMSQVHKARLISGEEVAIKIQRPRIRQIIDTDIDILYHLASLAERYLESARVFRVSQLVDEFERVIRKELDFSIEAAHIETFRRNFKSEPRVYFPVVYSALTTRRVLVTELVHGTKITDVDQMNLKKFDRAKIAQDGAQIVLKQLFDHGFFHADPHPGNILIRDNGSICFLDCGAVGIIAPALRYHIGVILYGVVSKDSERIMHTLMRLTNHPIQNPEYLEYDIAEFVEEHASLSLQEMQVSEVLQRFAHIVVRHNLNIIPGFYLLMKALVTFEGVAYRLDPGFTMVTYLEPYIRKLVRINPRWKFLPYDLYFAALDFGSLLKDLPFEFRDIVKLIKSGETRIQFEHRGLEPLMVKSEQLVNRIVFSIVVAALIIGSSIVVHADIPPKIYDISFVGLGGFTIAGLIGFGLLFSILRHRKM